MSAPVWQEPGLRQARAFAFVSGAPIHWNPKLRALVEQHGGRTLPLWGERVVLDACTIQGPSAGGLALVALATDKDVYREADDPVVVLIAAPLHADGELALELSLAGETLRTVTVPLDWNGMGVRTLAGLTQGAYVLRAGGATTRFEVAGYSLAPLAAQVRECRLSGGELCATLDVSALSCPVDGRLQVELCDGDRELARQLVTAERGRAEVRLPLAEGTLSLRISRDGDPGVIAQVPLRGTSPADRRPEPFARLGRAFAATLLKVDGATSCRGLWIHEEAGRDEPVHLDRPVASVGRLLVREPLEEAMLTVVQPAHAQLRHRRLGSIGAGEVIEFGVAPPFTLAAVGGFHRGRAWEGIACLIAPSPLELSVEVPPRAGPGEELPVTISTGAAAEVSVMLVVRDARLAPSDHPAIGMAAALKSALTDFRHRFASRPYRELTAGELRTLVDVRVKAARPVPRLERAPERRLGDLLVEAGLVTAEQIESALAAGHGARQRIGSVLVEHGLVNEVEVAQVVAQQHELPYVELANFPFPPQAKSVLPLPVAASRGAVLLASNGGMEVAMETPLSPAARQATEARLGCPVRLSLTSASQLQLALLRVYGDSPDEALTVRLSPERPVGPGERADITIEIPVYQAGDLAHVCLPPALARLSGGARVQSFSVDFAGANRVSIPLVGTGGATGVQHYFACVRNMFVEERIGSPGLLEARVRS